MRGLIVTGLFALTGCAGVQQAFTYDINSKTFVQMPDDRYRIFEHPDGDKLMTTPSLGTSFSQGAATGATLGLVDRHTPQLQHQAAARKHLDDTGRAHCEIVSGKELVKTQFEFVFSCPEQAHATAPSRAI